MSAMAECLVCPHSETGVEKEHALSSPTAEIATHRDRSSRLSLYLLEDITQRGREFHAIVDTKAQTMSLPYPMVRVLPQDDHLDLVKWRTVEGIEDKVSGRKAKARGVFGMNKTDELAKVRFGKLVA